MCGIAGIARLGAEPPDDRRTLEAMLERIRHRGPDDEGIHQSGDASIGMRRLAIIDLAGGHQPICNEDRTVWVVNNGEIYNFKRLRSQLERSGHAFATRSDTEVIVHAYEEWGQRFVEHLEGMFALAVWDSRRRTLLLARDRLGIKPLYYQLSNGRLAFASEVKALLQVPWVGVALDDDALRDHLSVGCAVAPSTIFRGVSKLRPAEMLVWRSGTVGQHRYWHLPDAVDARLTESAWVERLRADLDRAIDDHLIADVPVGAFLSGGIDSSTIVGLMARRLDQPVNTYAIGYTGSKVADYYNELPYALQVAQRYSTNHREILVQPNVAQLLPKLIWHLEEPISDTAIITTYLVSELASHSVKVIMSGVGGDELFGGYTRYLGASYGASYRRIPAWVRRVLEPLSELLPSGRGSRFLDLSRYAKQFVRSGRLDWGGQYRTLVQLIRPQVLARMIDGGIDCSTHDGFQRALAEVSTDDPLLRLFTVDANAQLSEALLLLSDKMTMAVSLECRVPLLDQKLVETAASIPASMKVRGTNLKYLFKQAVSDVLPADIRNRKKRGFGAPLGSWLQRELRPLRAELLGPRGLGLRGLFNAEVLGRICTEHDQSREDYTDLLMTLMNLEIWCRIFVDGATPADVGGDLAERMAVA